MTEKLITIKDTDINKILGSNNAKFNKIKTYFPQVKLISRGDQVKIIGSKKEISLFELIYNLFIFNDGPIIINVSNVSNDWN